MPSFIGVHFGGQSFYFTVFMFRFPENLVHCLHFVDAPYIFSKWTNPRLKR